MTARSVSEMATDFAVLMQFDMGVDDFASDWAYCDRLSSYMARMVSHNRTDSVLYSNLLSSALNELLETVFRRHQPGRDFVCTISRNGPYDRIELTIPADAETAQFYRDAIGKIGDADADDRYRKALFTEGPLSADIGLMELSIDYAARIFIEEVNGDVLRLVAELALEEGYAHVA